MTVSARTRGRSRAYLAAGVLSVLLLVPPGALAAPPTGATGHIATVGVSAWAYGGSRSFHTSGTTRNGTFSLSGQLGYEMILTATSSSSGVTLVEGIRTMGAHVLIQYCAPSCSAPSIAASIDLHALEVVTGFSNLTNTSAVTVNGSAVPAIGVINSSASLRDVQFENDSATVQGPLRAHAATANMTLSVTGAFSVRFSPALGVIPLHPAVGTDWSSTSGFTSVGMWTSRSSWQRTSMMGVFTHGGNALTSGANRSGNLTLSGRDLGALILHGGAPTQMLGVSLSGPLAMREGFFLFPASADLFAGAPMTNAPGGNASLGEAPDAVDYSPPIGGGMGLLASSATFDAESHDPGAGAGGGLVPAATSGGSGPQGIQAQPESIADARGSSQCLISAGCAPGGPASGSPGPAGLRPLLGVASAGTFLAALVVALIFVSRRPKVPPRAHPELYPAPARGGVRTRPVDRETSGTSPDGDDESDPLGHLW